MVCNWWANCQKSIKGLVSSWIRVSRKRLPDPEMGHIAHPYPEYRAYSLTIPGPEQSCCVVCPQDWLSASAKRAPNAHPVSRSYLKPRRHAASGGMEFTGRQESRRAFKPPHGWPDDKFRDTFSLLSWESCSVFTSQMFCL